MEFKDELIGELSDNMNYEEILDILGMKDDVDFTFDAYLDGLSDEELIEMFEEYCYDYNEFLTDSFVLNEEESDY